MSRHLRADGKYATDEFGALLGGLAETVGQRYSSTRIIQYAKLLDDLSIEEVATACRRAASEGNGYLPSPGDLRRYVRPSADEAALVAWSGLTNAAASVGAYAPLAVEDRAAAQALRTVFGGWPEFCSECDGSYAWTQKRIEFVTAYKMAVRLASPAATPPILAGLTDTPTDGSIARLTAFGEVSRVEIIQITAGGSNDGTDRPDRALQAHGDGRGGD
jgi:hypothetical protein